MNLHIVHIPKLIAQKRASAFLGIIIIAMLWGGAALKYGADVQQDYVDTVRSNQNYALLFEENVLRSIGEIDKALLYLRHNVEAAKDSTDYQTIVNTTDVLSEIIVQFAIIDAKGIMRASNVGPQPAPALDLSDREHYKIHVAGKDDQLFISKPVIGRASNKWSVQFTRRFSNKDGSFAGVVVASMNPAHFTSFYDKLDLGSSTSVAMIGSDGAVRSSGGRAVAGLSLGQDLHGSNIFTRLQSGSDTAFNDPGLSPKESLFVTARKVRGYPLWVIVGTKTSEIYQSSWASVRQNIVIVAVLTIIILIALEHTLRAEAKAEAHIARLASEDPLTNLPNRRVFRLKLEKATSSLTPPSDDTSARNSFAVLFLDMDRFKVVNDTLGHRVGDMLLIEVAQRLNAVLRASDILARLGGDEFAILLPAVESCAEIEAFAKRIIETMGHPFQVDRHLISSSISIGIAVGPRDGDTADELLVAADLALYAVKVERRGVYRFYQKSMNDDVNDRRQIELDLRDALDLGQLELHYQPIIDVRHNTISGFEALARWHHPVKGMISPAKFIPVAEDCGLILPLGEWALIEACRSAGQWPDDFKIAVNLSPVQLSSPNLPSTVARILAETSLEPSRLALEITERVFLENSEKTMSILHQLKDLGVQISLDDFGTGYSSLSYLRSFPFDTIKIDRTFVSDLGDDESSRVIVQAVILIAGGLGIRTVAEGVETPLQHQLLSALGCDDLQGYLLSPPVPLAKVPALIEKFKARKTMAA